MPAGKAVRGSDRPPGCHPLPFCPNPVIVQMKSSPFREPFIWRSGWDSNPRAGYKPAYPISSRGRYDLFDTTPCLPIRIRSPNVRKGPDGGIISFCRKAVKPKTGGAAFFFEAAGRTGRRCAWKPSVRRCFSGTGLFRQRVVHGVKGSFDLPLLGQDAGQGAVQLPGILVPGVGRHVADAPDRHAGQRVMA